MFAPISLGYALCVGPTPRERERISPPVIPRIRHDGQTPGMRKKRGPRPRIHSHWLSLHGDLCGTRPVTAWAALIRKIMRAGRPKIPPRPGVVEPWTFFPLLSSEGVKLQMVRKTGMRLQIRKSGRVTLG